MSAEPIVAEYLKPEQVAALLQLSVKSVSRLVRTDATFPAIKLGAGRNASVRIPRARLLRWLDDRTQGVQRMKQQMHSSAKPASNGARADG